MITLQSETTYKFSLINPKYENSFIKRVESSYEAMAKSNEVVRLLGSAYPFLEDDNLWDVTDDFMDLVYSSIEKNITESKHYHDLDELTEEEMDEYFQEELSEHYYEYSELLYDDVETVLHAKNLTFIYVEISESYTDHVEGDELHLTEQYMSIQEVW